MRSVLGIDIGTYETKGVLLGEDGVILAQERRPHRVGLPAAGFVEHDPESVWWQGFLEVTQRLLAREEARSASVSAVACSGIGPCVLPVDGTGQPLRQAILYGVDTRAQRQIDDLNEALGAEEIWSRSGTALSSQSAGPKIAWLRDHEPEIFAEARWFTTCQSFVIGRLTDTWVIDQATAAYFHPYYDRRTGGWNLDGVPGAPRSEQLPPTVWSDEVIGGLTKEAARLTGLPEGTPVLGGAPDAAVEALSAGVRRHGDMMVMYGSSHFFIEVLDSPRTSSLLWPAPYLFQDTYLLAAGTATAGSFTRWLADLLDPSADGSDEIFTLIAQLAAESPPGARGLLALPHLSGERTPVHDASVRGGLFGVTLEHGRADTARAVIEAIAHSAASVLQVYADEGVAPQRIRAVGGGTKNPAWVQAISDISGRGQEVVRGLGASHGDGLLAAEASGFLDLQSDLDSWTDDPRTVLPRPELEELYAVQHEAYDRLRADTGGVLDLLRKVRDHEPI